LLINRFKFDRARSAYKPLAHLMAAALPQLPADAIIVPIPTIAPHVRQRGYDQVELIAKELAKLKSCSYRSLLIRRTNTVQRGTARARRQKQAREAFACRQKLNPKSTYLIIDDVSTTGATVNEAAKVLKAAGAAQVWVAVVAVQPKNATKKTYS
jgi:ComF family protein